MSVRLPDDSEISAIADYYGFPLSSDEVETYRPFVHGLLDSWNVVADAHEGIAPTTPERSWAAPSSDENPLNAWAVTSDITESDGGPLAGVRIAIKDNTAVAGIPMSNGSDLFEGFIPSSDATVVTRLLEAGATIAGKAVCEYLCFSGASITAVTGPVKNPWNPEYSAGGSSSGSGALVASGAVDVALGGDQGGSIRIPASSVGIVGPQPTWGLVPYTGGFPIEQTLDHLGPMARTVKEVAAVLDVIAGLDGHDPRQPADLTPQDYSAALTGDVTGLRIGILAEGFGRPESDAKVDETVRNAIATLASSGATVVDVSVPMHSISGHLWNVLGVEGATSQMIDNYGYGLNWKGLYDPEVMDHYGAKWRTSGKGFTPNVRNALLAGRHMLQTTHGSYYARARNLVPLLAAAYDEVLVDVDLLVMPTLPLLPKKIADSTADTASVISDTLEMLGNTAAFDITGHPAATVPAGLVNGLPVGLMIVGRQFDDATVLRAADAWERVTGGFPTPS